MDKECLKKKKLPAADIKSCGKNNAVLADVSVQTDTCWRKAPSRSTTSGLVTHNGANFPSTVLAGPSSFTHATSSAMHLNCR